VNVNPNTSLSIQFNEPVIASTAQVQFRDPANNVVPAAITYDEASRTLAVNPSQDLGLGKVYQVVLSGVQDVAGSAMSGSYAWSFTTSSQVKNASLWDLSAVPAVASAADPDPVQVGVKFSSNIAGYVTGVRFYKGAANTGTHVAHVWNAAGTMLATATFANESGSGWQQVNFDTPVPIDANTVYVASYFAPNGNYAVDADYFTSERDAGRLSAPAGANGVFRYGPDGGFPTSSFRSSNYWVDVLFSNVLTDVTPPAVVARTPAPGATGVSPTASVTATLSEDVDPATISFVLRDAAGQPVAADLAYNSASRTVTLTPRAALAQLATYTATLGGAQDLAGNAMPSAVTWSFTALGPDLVAPTVIQRSPAPGAATVAPSAAVRVVFSESVQFATISFTLTDPTGHAVESLLTYDDSTHTAMLSPGGEDDGGLPEESLLPATTYTAALSGVRDLAGNLMQPVSWTFTTDVAVSNVSLWPASAAPANPAVNDPAPVEVGFKFQPAVDGYITALKFYKGSTNTGAHVAHLWDAAGNLLTTAPFLGETASGWQQVTLASPVPVIAGKTYVASYYAPNGNYAATAGYFSSAGVTNGPLTALSNAAAGGNGLYHYGAGGGFPNSSYAASNYWVDVVFANTLPDDRRPPALSSRSPAAGAGAIDPTSNVTATFDEDISPSSLYFVLTDAAGATVPSVVSYDAVTRTATLNPQGTLAPGAVYTATVSATDATGNVTVPQTWSFTTAVNIARATLWAPGAVPATPSVSESTPVELGLKFRSAVGGYITGIRFYKGAGNDGTHVGHLWSESGALLATATFKAESSTGWQEVTFDGPVPVDAGQTYVASYYAPLGHYAVNGGYFASGGVTNGPLSALAAGASGGNGVFRYGSGGGFPTQSYAASNYWVDVVFSTTPVDQLPPSVQLTTPADGSVDVPAGTNVAAVLSEPIVAGTATLELRDSSGQAVAATVTFDPVSRTVTLAPLSPLAAGQRYVATISGGRDLVGNTMTTFSWAFTVHAPVVNGSLWGAGAAPAVASENDSAPIEVGVRFSSSVAGYVTGVRFYKGDANLGVHVGHLWDSTGNLLASVTFTNETATGWQQANFSSPVAIVPGQVYVVSYYAPSGHYSSSGNYFGGGPYTNGPLTAPAYAAGGNGVYIYGAGGGFPNFSYNGTNYWVDVLFNSLN
jgi:methionine-rich copper-binding protein CopC